MEFPPNNAAHTGADTLIGQTIGNYQVTQKIGEGGMGSVYLAEHPHIGKRVALKVLHTEYASNQEVVSRFFNEAKAVNDIGHPNIVDVLDYGVLHGQRGERFVYFIMEFLAGQTLSQLMRSEGPFSQERAIAIAYQAADALAASHRCGIVHRDLKPDNIIVSQRGRERDFVKLLDFGIAKLTTEIPGSQRTRTGVVMGTPSYMSPEQCEGKGRIDQRTDIYALGILLFEMLSGRVPFVGQAYGDILVQHLTQAPPPLSSLCAVSPHLEAVVLKALEKRIEYRYPSMEEFAAALVDPVGYIESRGGLATFSGLAIVPTISEMPSLHATPSMPSMTMTASGVRSTAMPSGLPMRASGNTLTPAPPGYPHLASPHFSQNHYPSQFSQGGPTQPRQSTFVRHRTKLIALAAGVVLLTALITVAVLGTGGGKPGTVNSASQANAPRDAASLPEDSGSSGSAAIVVPDPAQPRNDAAQAPTILDAPNATDDASRKDAADQSAETVAITIVVAPRDAIISVNDQSGQSPFTVNISRHSKEVKITARRAGFETRTQQLNIDSGPQAVELKWTLKKKKAGGGNGKDGSGDGDGLMKPGDL